MSSESSWGNNHHFVHIGKTKYKWNFGKNIDDPFFFFVKLRKVWARLGKVYN